MISSVTQSFCHSCSRARVSTDGKLFTCLFATDGHDLRPLMRGGCLDEQLSTAMAHIWRQRTDRYSDLAAPRPASFKRPARRRLRCPTLAAELATTMDKERYP